MPKPSHISFSFQEIATLMLRETDIKEGHWGILLRFGIQGTNIQIDKDLTPAAIVAVGEIGLQQFDKPSSLTADASVVNKDKPKAK